MEKSEQVEPNEEVKRLMAMFDTSKTPWKKYIFALQKIAIYAADAKQAAYQLRLRF